jgi:hypothetical protein
MKTSAAGKALGPQPNEWHTRTHDGEQVMVTPGGRVLRLQQLHYSQWVRSPFDPADTKFFVEAANLLREKNNVERLNEQMLAFVQRVSTAVFETPALLCQEARSLLNEIARSKTT